MAFFFLINGERNKKLQTVKCPSIKGGQIQSDWWILHSCMLILKIIFYVYWPRNAYDEFSSKKSKFRGMLHYDFFKALFVMGDIGECYEYYLTLFLVHG